MLMPRPPNLRHLGGCAGWATAWTAGFVLWLAGCVAAPQGPGQDSAGSWPTLHLATDGPILDRLHPAYDRCWLPGQAALPYAEFDGDWVRVHNIRNCEYRTPDDLAAHYHDRTFDLRKLRGVDLLAISPDDAAGPRSVVMSFAFGAEDFLAVSVEPRREKGEKYSPLAGLFNQYQLIYVLADERDILRKETAGGGHEVCLYRTRATPEQARLGLIHVLRRVNKLAGEPEFYNTLTNNCATNVCDCLGRLAPDRARQTWRAGLAGEPERLAYDLGLLMGGGSLEEAKVRGRVEYQAYLHRDDPDLSRMIRL